MNPVVERVFATELAHRAVPWPIARRAVLALADRAWARDGRLREDARWQMRYLIGATERAGEVDELAQHYVREVYLRLEAYWRPRLTTSKPPADIRGLLHLQRAKRCAIVTFMHHGNYVGHLGSVCAAGIPLQIPAWTGIVDDEAQTDDSAYFRTAKAQTLRTIHGSGGNLFEAGGSRERIRSLLLAGRIAGIAADIPGNTGVTVLGRTVLVAAGAARLAFETGALVVPMTVSHDGRGQFANLEAQLDPRDYTEPKGLLEDMMRLHERSLLAWPQGLERPLRRWHVTAADEAEFGEASRSTLTI